MIYSSETVDTAKKEDIRCKLNEDVELDVADDTERQNVAPTKSPRIGGCIRRRDRKTAAVDLVS